MLAVCSYVRTTMDTNTTKIAYVDQSSIRLKADCAMCNTIIDILCPTLHILPHTHTHTFKKIRHTNIKTELRKKPENAKRKSVDRNRNGICWKKNISHSHQKRKHSIRNLLILHTSFSGYLIYVKVFTELDILNATNGN